MNRRQFLETAAIVAGGAVILGTLVYLRQENSRPTEDQDAAKILFERVQKEGKVTEFRLINPDEVDEPAKVNIRANPAIFTANRIARLRVGKEFEGFLVRSVGGREKTDPNLSGPWAAIKLEDDKFGFVHNRYVERTDGKYLYENLVIYDVRSGEVIYPNAGQ